MTRYGWRALGLMQLSPDVLAKSKVQNPFNLEENLTAGVAEFSRLKELLWW